MAFHAAYTIPETQRAIVKHLQYRGLRRSLSRDKQCIIQWVPFSKTNWNRALNHEIIVGNILVHSGLANKHELFRILQTAADGGNAIVADLLPRTFTCTGADSSECSRINDGLEKLSRLLRRLFPPAAGSPGENIEPTNECGSQRWVVKGSATNNATEVFIVDSDRACAKLLLKLERSLSPRNDDDESGQPPLATATTSWVVQEYLETPLLLHGKLKFHLRCNVLVVGNAEFFVHRNFICHAATEVRECC